MHDYYRRYSGHWDYVSRLIRIEYGWRAKTVEFKLPSVEQMARELRPCQPNGHVYAPSVAYDMVRSTLEYMRERGEVELRKHKFYLQPTEDSSRG